MALGGGGQVFSKHFRLPLLVVILPIPHTHSSSGGQWCQPLGGTLPQKYSVSQPKEYIPRFTLNRWWLKKTTSIVLLDICVTGVCFVTPCSRISSTVAKLSRGRLYPDEARLFRERPELSDSFRPSSFKESYFAQTPELILVRFILEEKWRVLLLLLVWCWLLLICVNSD
jgi:hypothetical protein